MRVGFIGLGSMGEPMVANLLRAGHHLTVWNRSRPAVDRLRILGAEVASTPWDVLHDSEVTVEMLADEAVIETVLDPRHEPFPSAVRGRGLLHMGTVSPRASLALGGAVEAAGGWYVEAPVSGSRVPALEGSLVAMVAGAPDHIARVEPLLEAMCSRVLRCGAPPSATLMKLAVNVHLIGLVTSLSEAWQFAAAYGLDLEVLASAVTSGQLGSPVAAVKLDKLARADFEPQASITNVLMNARLIADAAASQGIAVPVLDSCLELFVEAAATENAGSDMVAVVHAITARSSVNRPPVRTPGRVTPPQR